MKTVLSTIAALAVLSLAACSSPAAAPSTTEPAKPTESKTLTVVTHDSFALPEDLLEDFAKDSGYEVKYVAPGDSTSLVNQLILTKDSPLGDVVFGIDSISATTAAKAGILNDYVSTGLPASATELAADQLTPIDYSDVCINADKAWFAEREQQLPETLADLTKPEYRDLLVLTNPTTSSPGLAFLIATVGEQGAEAYLDYWQRLKDNGARIASGWSEAYYTDFSGADGKGDRPLVLSYATSPAYTLTDGTSTTTALLETCFRQVEYAGVLAGAENEIGARKFIDFLLSEEVQAALPENMFMYPVDSDTPLPADWEQFAPLAEEPIKVPGAEIDANRELWLRDWAEEIG